MKYKDVLYENLYDEIGFLLKKVDEKHALNLIVDNGSDVKTYPIHHDFNVSLGKNIIKIDNGNFLIVIPMDKIISCVFIELKSANR